MSTWLSLCAPTHAPPPLQFGYTAIHRAARRGDSTTVEVLLKAGANTEARDTVGLEVGREGRWGAGLVWWVLAGAVCVRAWMDHCDTMFMLVSACLSFSLSYALSWSLSRSLYLRLSVCKMHSCIYVQM